MNGSRKNRTMEPDLTWLLRRQTLHVVPKFLSFSLTNLNQYDAKTFIRKCLLKCLANEKTRGIVETIRLWRRVSNDLWFIDKFILDGGVQRNVEKSTKTSIEGKKDLTFKTLDQDSHIMTSSQGLNYQTANRDSRSIFIVSWNTFSRFSRNININF